MPSILANALTILLAAKGCGKAVSEISPNRPIAAISLSPASPNINPLNHVILSISFPMRSILNSANIFFRFGSFTTPQTFGAPVTCSRRYPPARTKA